MNNIFIKLEVRFYSKVTKEYTHSMLVKRKYDLLNNTVKYAGRRRRVEHTITGNVIKVYK